LLPDVVSPAKVAIVTGDPGRVPHFASALGTVSNSWRWRELDIREVCDGGVSVIVASHGMGGPSAALVAEELIDSGITSIIRIGSCGALQETLEEGMVVIPTGIVRDDGTSSQYLPIQVPLVPDHDLLVHMRGQLEQQQMPYRLGLTHCKDVYYCQDPDRVLTEDSWHERWRRLHRLGVLATDGESGALLAVATLRGIRAASALVVGCAGPDRALANLVSTAVCAAKAGLAVTAGAPPHASGNAKTLDGALVQR
jgi:uridine phosphorylase